MMSPAATGFATGFAFVAASLLFTPAGAAIAAAIYITWRLRHDRIR